MSNLITRVEELKELEKKATRFPWSFGCLTCEHTQYSRIYDSDTRKIATIRPDRRHGNEPSGIPESDLDDARFICNMRNAAPTMLMIMGQFREGDAEILEKAIEIIDFSIPSELCSVEEGDEELDFAPEEYKDLVRVKSALNRLQEACMLMEAKSE